MPNISVNSESNGKLASMPVRIMVVCTGNICRSAMAEVVLREKISQAGLKDRVQVASAGISNEEAGNSLDYRARWALEINGYSLNGNQHRARQITRDEIPQYDLLLAMTRSHKASLERLGGVGVKLWNDFDPQAISPDVTDPWYGSQNGFLDTLSSVERGSVEIINWVKNYLLEHNSAD